MAVVVLLQLIIRSHQRPAVLLRGPLLPGEFLSQHGELRFSSGDSATTSSRMVSAMNIYLLFLVSLELRDYNGNVLSEHKRRKIIFEIVD